MSEGDRAVVVIPCYNERENIGRLVEQIAALEAPLDVLVIDDNSPDGTGELVQQLTERYPWLHLMSRPGKLGLGTAYRAGFHYGLNHGYLNVLTMDADFSHQPRYLPALVEAGLSFDLVIGSRYVEGGGAEGWPLYRRIISGGANWLAHTVLGLSARDCTSGFRCYSRRALQEIDVDSVLSSGYSFLVEMLYRVEKHGCSVRELPIIFVDREEGVSKIDRREIYKTLFTLGRLRMPLLPWARLETVVLRYDRRLALASLLIVLLLLAGWSRKR